MKLTKKKAIEISISLWAWLAETGRDKYEWDGWAKYGGMNSWCALCEYSRRQWETKGYLADYCDYCPYFLSFAKQCTDKKSPYYQWQNQDDEASRKKYAAKFLKQLIQIVDK